MFGGGTARAGPEAGKCRSLGFRIPGEWGHRDLAAWSVDAVGDSRSLPRAGSSRGVRGSETLLRRSRPSGPPSHQAREPHSRLLRPRPAPSPRPQAWPASRLAAACPPVCPAAQRPGALLVRIKADRRVSVHSQRSEEAGPPSPPSLAKTGAPPRSPTWGHAPRCSPTHTPMHRLEGNYTSNRHGNRCTAPPASALGINNCC